MRTLTVVALLWTSLTLHPETAAAKFVYQPCPDLQIGGVWQIDVYLGNTLNNTQTWNLSQFESAGVGGAAAGPVHCAIEGVLVSSTDARFPEEGRLDASQLTVDETQPLGNGKFYTAHFVGTVVFDAGIGDLKIDGTFSDTFGRVGEMFHGRRLSGPDTFRDVHDGPIERKSFLYTICNRGPNPTDDFECTATAGAADGDGPPPSGDVEFSATSGGFPNSDVCTLASSAGPDVVTSSCSVTYSQPPEGISAGKLLPITAVYDGDAVYAGFTDNLLFHFVKRDKSLDRDTIFALPVVPLVCFSDQAKACDGLNAIALSPNLQGTSVGPITVSYYNASAPPPVLRAQSAAASSPKPTGNGIGSVSLHYFARLEDNPDLVGLPAVQKFTKALGKGLDLGGFKTVIGVGTSITLSGKLSSSGKKLVAALLTAGHPDLNVVALVSLKRKGFDKKAATYASLTTAHLGM